MRKLFLVSVLAIALGQAGCLIDETTGGVGSCFLGNGNPCDTSTSPIIPPPEIPGIGPFNWFRLRTLVDDFRGGILHVDYDADSIPVVGDYIGDIGIPSQGSTTHINDITASITAPVPGDDLVQDARLPALWDFTWITSTHSVNIASLGLVSPGTGIPVDVCALQSRFAAIIPSQLVILRCIVTQTVIGGNNLDLAAHVTPPIESASNPVDMRVQASTSHTYIPGATYVVIYDVYGHVQSCFGNGCAPVSVSGDGSSLVIPGWGLAYNNQNAPGYYGGEISTLQGGAWVSVDTFAFEITHGGEPVYRFYNSWVDDHFYSPTLSAPSGFYLEGIGFYVFDRQMTMSMYGTTEMWSLYDPCHSRFFYSANLGEVTNLISTTCWQNYGSLGLVLVNSAPNTIPLYRLRQDSVPYGHHFFTTSWPEANGLLSPAPIQTWIPAVWHPRTWHPRVCNNQGHCSLGYWVDGYWSGGYYVTTYPSTNWAYEGVAAEVPPSR